jgi:hypothetical protein
MTASPAPHPNVTELSAFVADRLQGLLSHPYFEACRSGTIERDRVIRIIKQLYCQSVFFERIITLRLARFTSRTPPEIVRTARRHLQEEIGHPGMFLECLAANGATQAEIDAITPSMMTKTLFGYLLATIEYEREEVSNVAVFQVMESAAYHFFSATLGLMRLHGFSLRGFEEHASADEDHSTLGSDVIAQFDAATMKDSRRIIADLFRLMTITLDEWTEFA